MENYNSAFIAYGERIDRPLVLCVHRHQGAIVWGAAPRWRVPLGRRHSVLGRRRWCRGGGWGTVSQHLGDRG